MPLHLHLCKFDGDFEGPYLQAETGRCTTVPGGQRTTPQPLRDPLLLCRTSLSPGPKAVWGNGGTITGPLEVASPVP